MANTTTQNADKTPKIKQTTTQEANQIIRDAVNKKGSDIVKEIDPILFSMKLKEGYDPKDKNILLEKCVEVTPRVNPLLDAVLTRIGMTRSGERSYVIGVGKNQSQQTINMILEALPKGTLFSPQHLENAHKNGSDTANYQNLHDIVNMIRATPAGKNMDRYKLQSKLNTHNRHHNYYSRMNQEQLFKMLKGRYKNLSMIGINANEKQLYLTICTAWNSTVYNPNRASMEMVEKENKRKLLLFKGAPDLNLFLPKEVKDPVSAAPDTAVALAESLVDHGFELYDDGNLVELRNTLTRYALGQREVGSPGKARIVVGKDAIDKKEKKALESFQTFGPEWGILRSTTTSSEQAGKLIEKVASQNAESALHPSVLDVIQMSRAKQTDIEGLRPYQNEMVALHLATQVGVLNACSPGLGKTTMTLAACREKAKDAKDLKVFVTCPSAIRTQWKNETNKFFPEAYAEVIESKDHKKKLEKFLERKGPKVCIMSYNTMTTAKDLLANEHWDELVCDEAAILKSIDTGRTQALWQIRKNCGRAVALTGTPIEKNLDDMGRILAWSRNDEEMFYGQRLSQRFDATVDQDVTDLWDALGPTVFRRDRSEIRDQLPEIETEVITLDPCKEEKALADGARKELKRIYENLMKKVEIASHLNPNDKRLEAAKKELRQVRGAVLGGVTLARMAAGDPASLEGSDSAGVALLQAEGLLKPAMKKGGTKRKQISGLTKDLVDRGEAVLIFTDFASAAKHLAEDLENEGVSVKTFLGGQTMKVRDQAVKEFQEGDVDCLVLTGAAREGLNLQRASVLIHYDLPWNPSQIVQRVGRASRFGSTNSHLQILIPIMAGTIEEHVASIVLKRAVGAMKALDVHRGVKGSETEMGLAISGLEDAISEDEQKGSESIFEMAKEILGKTEEKETK